MDSTKVCRVCGETKPLDDFYKQTRGRDGKQSQCKFCQDNANRRNSHAGPKILPVPILSASQLERLWARVQKGTEEGCWLWTGPPGQSGFGKVQIGPTSFVVHRLVYANARGLIPERTVVWQTCRNRLCVRPDHLALKRSRSMVGTDEKYCPRCGEIYPIENFYGQIGARTKVQAYCKDCHRWDAYGITQRDYDDLYAAQNGCCGICGDRQEGRSLSVDHSHTTNRVRGLLCERCNVGLGMFRDRPDLLLAAARYLERTTPSSGDDAREDSILSLSAM